MSNDKDTPAWLMALVDQDIAGMGDSIDSAVELVNTLVDGGVSHVDILLSLSERFMKSFPGDQLSTAFYAAEAIYKLRKRPEEDLPSEE